jgi:hypothetical protein
MRALPVKPVNDRDAALSPAKATGNPELRLQPPKNLPGSARRRLKPQLRRAVPQSCHSGQAPKARRAGIVIKVRRIAPRREF